MANPEHLAILMQGVEAWNTWKRVHSPDPKPTDYRQNYVPPLLDLRGADLSAMDLRTVDLRRTYLVSADLRQADLRGADLTVADLREVNVSGANLSGANLTGAQFAAADLTLSIFGGTTFGATSLGRAKGLESARHTYGSLLDYHTIINSGTLPRNFLRGCGLSDQLIDYLPSLLNQDIQRYSGFISYSTNDQQFANRLWGNLQNANVRCWLATEDLKIGDPFRQRIEESIRLHDKLLLILSEHSVASAWVQDEVEAALERERREKRLVLFPIRIDDAVMDTEQAWAASIRRTRHIGDFTRWKEHDSYSKAFQRLLRDLKIQ
jgi:uncharacterized protein YjbI with pentapeptide repeats